MGDNETISYVKTQDLVESISYKDATEITYDFVVTTVQKISETQTTITENIVTRTYSNLSKQSFTPTLNGKITSVSVRLRKGEERMSAAHHKSRLAKTGITKTRVTLNTDAMYAGVGYALINI